MRSNAFVCRRVAVFRIIVVSLFLVRYENASRKFRFVRTSRGTIQSSRIFRSVASRWNVVEILKTLSNFPRLSNVKFFLPPKAMRKNTRIHDRIGISGMSSKSHRTRGSRLVRDCSKLIDIATQRLKDDSCEITALFIISFFIYIIDPRRLQPFERSPISRTIQFNRRKSPRRVRFVLSKR